MADQAATQNIEDVDIGAGSEFWLSDGNGNMVELAMVTEVPYPSETTDLVDVSHMKSPGRRKEYIGGWSDGDEAPVVMNYVPGSPTDILIRGAKASGKPRAYRTVLPTSDGTWVIEGFVLVRGYEVANPMDDRRQATMTVKFTGAETQEEGA